MEEKYIPKDLDDSIDTLIKMLVEEDYNELKNGPEDDMILQHHFLGRHLRNEWGLWHDSILSKWFNEQGIEHADDMSAIILTSFWRKVNDKPINLDEQIKEYQEYWKKNS